MRPYFEYEGQTVYHGDALDLLRELPDGCVDCCVTSPPYWGLRDYGTGSWEGGNPDCEHSAVRRNHGEHEKQATSAGTSRDRIGGEDCRKCGAPRVDRQLGLEATPEEYVARMVEVFREVRRVLAEQGTLWLNIGDSYATNPRGNAPGDLSTSSLTNPQRQERVPRPGNPAKNGGVSNRDGAPIPPGLKKKDLVGIPWLLAFALRADGWYLRADIIWAKPNPMPESVTDRPTKAHEYLFLLSKRPRYFFDAEAISEPAAWERWGHQTVGAGSNPNGWIKPKTKQELVGESRPGGRGDTYSGFNGRYAADDPASRKTRNVRSVWEIATQPYPEAHFAAYPEELVRRCVLAGVPEQVCRECGVPRECVVEYGDKVPVRGNPIDEGGVPISDMKEGSARLVYNDDQQMVRTDEGWSFLKRSVVGETWTDCGHGDYRPGIVLDPFAGAGTTALVARKLGRHSVGLELNEAYCELIGKRLSVPEVRERAAEESGEPVQLSLG